jgi:hypothetical protein
MNKKLHKRLVKYRREHRWKKKRERRFIKLQLRRET